MKEKLKKINQEALKKLEDTNIPISKNTKVSITTRATRRYGVCKQRGNEYQIVISDFIMNAPDSAIESVLLHEYIHTCPNCMNHGDTWKSYCDKINKKYGTKLQRTEKREFFNLEEREKPEYKYIFKCTHCDNYVRRTKNSKFVQKYELYRCGKCGNKFERIL